MNKNTKGLLVIVGLGIIASILIYFNKKSTFKTELRDFSVKDTTSINKLFLADREGNKSVLEKQSDGTWMVNGKFLARQDAISVLLKTLASIDIKAPVAKSAKDNVIKILATTARKIEIYQDDDLTKTYYIGSQDMDGTGTYMMLEGSNAPFITQIPGFQGYLTPRYIVAENEWRDRKVFSVKGKEITSFQLKYNLKPDASFTINMDKAYKINLKDYNGQPIQNFDTATVKEYLSVVPSTVFDQFVNKDLTQKTIDSLLKTTPIHEITIRSFNGKINTVKTYPVKAKEGSTDKEGKLLVYDLDFMYGLVNGKDFVYLQYFSFDNILRPVQYFYVGDEVLLKSK